MTTISKLGFAFSLLASVAACGSDDGDGKVMSVGPVVGVAGDAGTAGGGGASSGANGGGANKPAGGGDCFTGTPIKMEDFLNRCTSVQTATKTLAIPTALLTPTGGVNPL